jgi:hypothetical protein
MTSDCCGCKSAKGVTVEVKLVATTIVSGMRVCVGGRAVRVAGIDTFVDSSASSRGSCGGDSVAGVDRPAVEATDVNFAAITTSVIAPPMIKPIRNKIAGLLFKAQS